MIQKIVREELVRMVASKPNVFYLEPGSPLYEDMERILRETQGITTDRKGLNGRLIGLSD